MTTTVKILLSVGLVGLALSFTGILWGFCLPIGVVSLGMCMILKITEKEVALFDEDQRRRRQGAEGTDRLQPGSETAKHPLLISHIH